MQRPERRVKNKIFFHVGLVVTEFLHVIMILLLVTAQYQPFMALPGSS